MYTGDFRLENVKLPTLANLHSLAGEPLKIDVMYLDTTFCSKEYEKFPPRDHAYEAIWELANSWIRKNGMYVLHKAIERGVILLIAQAAAIIFSKEISDFGRSQRF